VLVHCRGGVGRAGTVAARILVELGTPATEAVRQVRAARAGAIETRSQLEHVLGLDTDGAGVSA
jgi:protein-tyrosine phosphatase